MSMAVVPLEADATGTTHEAMRASRARGYLTAGAVAPRLATGAIRSWDGPPDRPRDPAQRWPAEPARRPRGRPAGLLGIVPGLAHAVGGDPHPRGQPFSPMARRGGAGS
jgi:hypothetical protein